MAGAAIEAIETGRRYYMRKTASVTITLPWDLLHRVSELADVKGISFSAECAKKIQQGIAYEAVLNAQAREDAQRMLEDNYPIKKKVEEIV